MSTELNAHTYSSFGADGLLLRMFIPVGGSMDQHIWVIDKDAGGTVTSKRDMAVRYVPLTNAPT